MNPIRAVKGMNDLFPEELAMWQFIEKTTHDVFSRFGYQEIRTPILEDLNLFVRSVGDSTDIVEKEMYVLKDRDDSLLALRPENTAGVVRALVEHKTLVQESEYKVYYLGPMFRRERPQKGRLRQFHQIGAEFFGIAEPSADIELIAMLYQYFKELGIDNLLLRLNSLGDPDDRKNYVIKLVEYYEGHRDALCEDCKNRLTKNPLRLLDCKNPHCIEISKNVPEMTALLADPSRSHFDAVQQGLRQLNIPFELAPRLVRGIDYYSRTVFELIAITGLGAQNAVLGGGRYDTLTESLGGPKTPALGFACGIERIAILLSEKGTQFPKRSPALTFVSADAAGRDLAMKLSHELRSRGVYADFDHKERSVKAQMRRADKIASQAIIVLGERELSEKSGQIKNLRTGEAKSISIDLDGIISALRE
jgi:histidyl-tRNA synthetase